MDTALAKSTSGFLVGDRVTIADISSWGWVSSASKYHTEENWHSNATSWLIEIS